MVLYTQGRGTDGTTLDVQAGQVCVVRSRIVVYALLSAKYKAGRRWRPLSTHKKGHASVYVGGEGVGVRKEQCNLRCIVT